jgi:bifunctional DNase/RNase
VIEVRVGAIERHPVTGAPLVALEPCDTKSRTRLVLPLSAAVACSLSHELEGQATLRGLAYTLLGQVAESLGGIIAGIEIVPAPNGMAAGRLCIEGRDGATLLPVEIALGIGLAVVLGLPLRVAAQLVDTAPGLDLLPAEAAPVESDTADRGPVGDVPDAFRRAFTS